MRLIFTAFIIIFCSYYSIGQDMRMIGAKEGITTSQFSGDAHAGFHKYGMTGGLYYRTYISRYMSIQVECLFTQKGSRYYADYAADTANPATPYYTPGTYGYFLELNYLEFPVLFQYSAKKKYKGLVYETGISYGTLLKSREYITIPGYNKPVYGPPFKYYELNYIAGIAFNLKIGFGVAFRFSRSMLPVREYLRGEDPSFFKSGQQSTVFSLALTYQRKL